MTIGNTASKVIREELVSPGTRTLGKSGCDILQTLVSSLCYLIFFAPRERVADVDGWLVKLWEAISRQPKPSLDLATDLYERAINSAAGKLSETLLLEIAARTKAGNAPTSEQLHLIKTISTSGGAAGQLGRAVLANDIAFLLALDRQFVEETVGPRIKAETVEGAALRAVMLKFGSITPEVSQAFSQAIKRGVVENDSTDGHSGPVASKILRPALADLRGDNVLQWGLTASDLAEVLREAPEAIRCAVLDVLAGWLQDDQAGAEEAWRVVAIPFFQKIWPKEREFRSAS